MRIAFAPLIAAASLAGCSAETAAPQVAVEDALVTLPAVPGRPGAGYFRLETNREGTRLVGVSSPQAERIELHEAGMRPAQSFAFSPGEPLRLEPGGRHAMIYGLDSALRPGARIRLVFLFEGAPEAVAEAEVRAPGDVHPGH